MSTNVQVKVSIEDQNKNKLKDGEYKAIQIDFFSQKPAKANIVFNGNSIPIQKQRLQITFPNEDTFKIKGNNFGEPPEPNSPNVFRLNANTITIEDASDSNSIKEISVLPGANGPDWETLTQINNLSTVVISKSSSGPVQEDGKLLWSSEAWNNGKERTLKKNGEEDPHDSKIQLRAGENKKLFIDGKGTAFMSGPRVRMYIGANNYNAMMKLTYTHIKSLENLSLRLRSLRNEEDGFGGYGFIIHRDSVEAKYQTKYEGDNIQLGSKKLPEELPENSPVTVKWCVRDEGEKIQVKGWIDYGDGEFKEIYDALDDKFLDIARDKDTFMKSSTAWIRINNDKEMPKDVPFKNVTISSIK